MKKITVMAALVLAVCMAFTGCVLPVKFIPDEDVVGKTKTFEMDGLTLSLTDRFVETESELGYDGYFVADFGAVVVQKEAFAENEELAEYDLKEYVKRNMKANGVLFPRPKVKGDYCYYENSRNTTKIYSFTFKGTDAFWNVQYLCRRHDASMFEDLFFLWADCVEVE